MFRQSERKRTPLLSSSRAEEKSQVQSGIAEEETLIFHEVEWKRKPPFPQSKREEKTSFFIRQRGRMEEKIMF
jgi:hypothetical protein